MVRPMKRCATGLLCLGLWACSSPGEPLSSEASALRADTSTPELALAERKSASLPGARLQRVNSLVGDWRVTLESVSASQALVALAQGTASIRPDLGGRFLSWQTQLLSAGESVESRGRLGYDQDHEHFELLWVSELSSAQRIARGNGDPRRGGIQLEWADLDEETQAILRTRTVLEIEDDDHFRLEQWALDPETSEWRLLSRTNYVRGLGS